MAMDRIDKEFLLELCYQSYQLKNVQLCLF